MSAPSTNSRFALRLLVTLLVLGGLGVLAWRWLQPVAIVEPVVSGLALDAKPGSVTVTEAYALELKTDLPGRLVKKDFNLDPGEKVKAGQVLAQLDATDIQLAMDKDRIDYAATKERYKTDHSTELALESLHADLENFRRQQQQGSYPATEMAKREREAKIAELKADLEKIDHTQTLATFENSLKSEQHKLDQTTLRAPFDAVVSAVYKHPGDLIGQGDSIATLITTENVVVGKISEEDFANIRKGEKASVMFLTYSNWVYNGTVVKILPTADPETQRHVIHIHVDDITPDKLVPGINGEVSVVVGEHHAKAIVPRRALFSLNGDNVYVVKDGRVERRPVKKDYSWLTGVEIVEGLEPGEHVIVDGLEEFHDGQRVRTREIPSDAIGAVK